jgi:hypothetical protein
MKHKFSKIEIRVEKIYDKSDNQTFFWIYAHIDDDVKIIGKSLTEPNIIKYNVQMD